MKDDLTFSLLINVLSGSENPLRVVPMCRSRDRDPNEPMVRDYKYFMEALIYGEGIESAIMHGQLNGLAGTYQVEKLVEQPWIPALVARIQSVEKSKVRIKPNETTPPVSTVTYTNTTIRNTTMW